MLNIRTYQTDAIAKVLSSKSRGVLVACPTGGGKTVIAATIIARDLSMGRGTLFLAHRRELINQAFDRVVAAGISPDLIGIIMGSDARANKRAPIQIASVDTLRNRDLPDAERVFVDECHRSYAPTYRRIIDRYKSRGATIVGLSATPYRANGSGLDAVYDDLIVVAQPRELIAQGFLTAPRVFTRPAHSLPELNGVAIRRGDYDEKQLGQAVNHARLVGDIVSHWQRHGCSARTVVFAASVDHSKHIVQRFKGAGVACEHLDGSMGGAERDAILRRLRSGETQIVSNCSVLTEGWDMPDVKCCILARPTRSRGLYLQMVGRIMRPSDASPATILDHAGAAVSFGLPQDDQEYSLRGDSASSRMGMHAPCKVCPVCFAVVPAGCHSCTECNSAFERRELTEDTSVTLKEIGGKKPVDPYAAILLAWRDVFARSSSERKELDAVEAGLASPGDANAFVHFADENSPSSAASRDAIRRATNPKFWDNERYSGHLGSACKQIRRFLQQNAWKPVACGQEELVVVMHMAARQKTYTYSVETASSPDLSRITIRRCKGHSLGWCVIALAEKCPVCGLAKGGA